MAEYKASAKKSTISFMRVSLRMTYTMDMVDIFILTGITTSGIGSMGSGPAGESLSTNQEKSMKECGSTVSSSEVELNIRNETQK